MKNISGTALSQPHVVILQAFRKKNGVARLACPTDTETKKKTHNEKSVVSQASFVVVRRKRLKTCKKKRKNLHPRGTKKQHSSTPNRTSPTPRSPLHVTSTRVSHQHPSQTSSAALPPLLLGAGMPKPCSSKTQREPHTQQVFHMHPLQQTTKSSDNESPTCIDPHKLFNTSRRHFRSARHKQAPHQSNLSHHTKQVDKSHTKHVTQSHQDHPPPYCTETPALIYHFIRMTPLIYRPIFFQCMFAPRNNFHQDVRVKGLVMVNSDAQKNVALPAM